MTTPVPPVSSWKRTLGLALAASAVVGVLLLAFTWPSVTSEPRDIRLALVGPETQTAPIEQALAGEIFTLVPATDRAQAVRDIHTREVAGAIILGAQPEVLTASAGSPVIDTMLGSVRAELEQTLSEKIPGATVALTDIVPLSDSDPRGAGLTTAAFPLTLGGMIGGVLIAGAVVGARRRLTALLAYAAIGGALIAVLLQGPLGILQGSLLLNAAAAGAALLATSALIVGLATLIGPAGIGVGAVITLFVGNPISAATAPASFLPGAWGAIGQYFVPGASATLLRNISYFPDAPTAGPWLVLAGWTALGLVLLGLGARRERARRDKNTPAVTASA
ncbi:hypothetical protein [Mycetocola spongiae]|uniref:hypothetical protein n=1 Tax=Mycetocola spongiae TaxID=2859226 RepID=UPI001CF110AC|nr:hypothetical protein [Mycetocola spongiae]UCR89732.1 hypothetical protein KXZ72_03385 [Mycetocola spongiae]